MQDIFDDITTRIEAMQVVCRKSVDLSQLTEKECGDLFGIWRKSP